MVYLLGDRKEMKALVANVSSNIWNWGSQNRNFNSIQLISTQLISIQLVFEYHFKVELGKSP